VADYAALLKPRVMSLVVFTALVGMVAAARNAQSGARLDRAPCDRRRGRGGGALNMWYDADIDALMRRTRRATDSGGRLAVPMRSASAIVLGGFAIVLLGLAANWLAAALLAFTIFFYVAIYTAWLKRLTAQNIVIGGAAGRCRR
jgi:protoheme IX farnesyltransferase